VAAAGQLLREPVDELADLPAGGPLGGPDLDYREGFNRHESAA
jgi:hypothetical protein